MSHEDICDLFEKSAARFATNIAIQTPTRQMSYEELERGANRLANYLIDKGVGAWNVVSILADYKINMITAVIGTLKAGAGFVPMDATLPVNRLRVMKEEIGGEWYVIEEKHKGLLGEVVKGGGEVRVIVMDGEAEGNGSVEEMRMEGWDRVYEKDD